MAKFIKNIIVFGTLICVCYVSIIVICANSKSVTKQTYNYVNNYSDSIETLVLGNSQAFCDINPDLMPDARAYNAAFNNHSLIESSNFYRNYLTLSDKDCCSRLILNVSIFDFTRPPFTEQTEWQNSEHYLLYGKSDSIDNSCVEDKIYNSKHKWLAYVFRPTLCRLMVIPWLTDPLDIRKPYSTNGHSEAGIIAKPQYAWDRSIDHAATIPSENEYSQLYEEALRSILETGDENNHIYIVLAPSFSEYNRNINKEALNRYYERMNRLSKQYEFVFLDYLNDDRFTQEDFEDPMHLLVPNGSDKFTKVLWDDIKWLEDRQE